MSRAADCLARVVACGVVVVARLASTRHLDGVAEACAWSGCRALEVTLDTPGAIEWLEHARSTFGGRVALGAGTVIGPAAARDALTAGAEFLVSPVLDERVIRLANDADALAVPGAFTPTEIVRARDSGAGLVKVFPASIGGPAYLSALRGPLGGIPLLATGGITPLDAPAYWSAGAAAVGLGGSLLSERRLAEDGLEEVRRLLRAAVRARGLPPGERVERAQR